MISEYNNEEQVPKFVGVPIKETPEEQSKWRKFLYWLAPWLGDKVQSADQFVDNTMKLKEAELAKTWSEEAKNNAETEKLKAESVLLNTVFKELKEIAENAQRIENEKTAEIHHIKNHLKNLKRTSRPYLNKSINLRSFMVRR